MANNIQKEEKNQKKEIINFYQEIFKQLNDALIKFLDFPENVVDKLLQESLKKSYDELKRIFDNLISPPKPDIPEIPEQDEESVEPVHGEPYELSSEVETEETDDLEPLDIEEK